MRDIFTYQRLSLFEVGNMVVRLFLKFVPAVSGDKLERVVGGRHEERLGLGLCYLLHLSNPHLITCSIFHYPRIALFFPQLSSGLGNFEDLFGLLLKLSLWSRSIFASGTSGSTIAVYRLSLRIDHDNPSVHAYYWLSVRPNIGPTALGASG